MLHLKLETDPRWVTIVESNIEEILVDHAWCEQKAATNAITIITHNSEYEDLVTSLLELAKEELDHFQMVHEIIKQRGYTLGPKRKDHYVNQLFEFMKDKTNTKVIAFAMETDDKAWLKYKNTMPGWHHVLGLGKWENKIARTYQVNSTPTYFVLGMDKKIISNPEKLEDLKLVLEQLN